MVGNLASNSVTFYRNLTSPKPPPHPAAVIGAASPRLAIAGARPNPAHGAPFLMFTLPETAPARLEIFDVAGRCVGRDDLPAPAAGLQTRRLRPDRPLSPGLYLARVTQGARSAVARFVVIQ